MGYVQSKPSVSDNGTISIQYHNGDLCHKGKEHESYRSMVIFFVCHGTEQGPEFREETPECQYIIDWKTPSACPAKVSHLYKKVEQILCLVLTTNSGRKLQNFGTL